MLRALIVGVLFFCELLLGSSLEASAPRPWQIGFQEPATEIMELIAKSHNFTMLVMSAVAVVVFSLMVYVLIKFRRRRGEEVEFNNRNSHNVTLEVLWTLVPLLIVGLLTISNVKLIRKEQQIPKADVVVKAIGYQWYWSYVYPEAGIRFDSYMKNDSDLKSGELRLLEVDNRMVVPVGEVVLLQSTAGDVIHSWAVPALGIKVDAIPGRLNEAWFSVKKPGVYYGQCSELCGRLHGFMPIVVEAVTRDKFDEWVAKQKDSAG
ncbi:cytochrome c oxidase subunit II [Anaplasma capra]|uniref:cytochrome c oxidase subunit II n=1 Tax=Anaplasma capra TaxID=1562740 RepID=UPI0021D57B14|nr:cytochrome c oxidase subunit II [Anaplasma capra]MCU7611805.1 cytochrome c oxidase subunit II [Anaplasma capra]MCU7612648.1 cytochrome c oxidase subunit II [Anaplasma capra]